MGHVIDVDVGHGFAFSSQSRQPLLGRQEGAVDGFVGDARVSPAFQLDSLFHSGNNSFKVNRTRMSQSAAAHMDGAVMSRRREKAVETFLQRREKATNSIRAAGRRCTFDLFSLSLSKPQNDVHKRTRGTRPAVRASMTRFHSVPTVFLIAATRPSLFILCTEHFTLRPL